VVDGRALLPRIVEQFVVALDLRAGEDFGAAIFGESRGGKQPADEPEAADDGAAVGLLAQIARARRSRSSRCSSPWTTPGRSPASSWRQAAGPGGRYITERRYEWVSIDFSTWKAVPRSACSVTCSDRRRPSSQITVWARSCGPIRGCVLFRGSVVAGASTASAFKHGQNNKYLCLLKKNSTFAEKVIKFDAFRSGRWRAVGFHHSRKRVMNSIFLFGVRNHGPQ
jgi:hypothetical protein